jgi:acetyl esterase/lipase
MRLFVLLALSALILACSPDKAIIESGQIDPINPPSPVEIENPVRITYGNEPAQFGDLRIPEGTGPFPVIMIIHGGCWLSSYDLSLMDDMAEDLTDRGYATWNLEYRRTGDPGGGWPGTFHDVAIGLNHLKTLSNDYPIDMDKIMITGHSAGGHLALWLGAQSQLPEQSEIKVPGTPAIKGILSLAGITDLKSYYSPGGCGGNVVNLIGGNPSEYKDRYEAGSPISFVPLDIPQVLINGESDNIVPLSHIRPYYDQAISARDSIQLVTIAGAGHFEVIAPGSSAWPSIIQAFEKLAK